MQDGEQTGIGARMVERANELKGLLSPEWPSSEISLRNYVELMEIQRTLSLWYVDEIR